MREVDEALARAYAQRAQSDLPQGVPPAPHLPPRALHSAPEPARRNGDLPSSCNGLRCPLTRA